MSGAAFSLRVLLSVSFWLASGLGLPVDAEALGFIAVYHPAVLLDSGGSDGDLEPGSDVVRIRAFPVHVLAPWFVIDVAFTERYPVSILEDLELCASNRAPAICQGADRLFSSWADDVFRSITSRHLRSWKGARCAQRLIGNVGIPDAKGQDIDALCGAANVTSSG